MKSYKVSLEGYIQAFENIPSVRSVRYESEKLVLVDAGQHLCHELDLMEEVDGESIGDILGKFNYYKGVISDFKLFNLIPSNAVTKPYEIPTRE